MRLLICIALLCASQTARGAEADLFTPLVRTTQPMSPAEEQAGFVLPEGFKIQLVASEPDIAKPLNMAFDTRGRLWVTNSLEYPYPAPADRTARDSIKILEDTTGDGHADKITTFADGLNIPMGLYPYADGVICFSIPNIWFLRDTDGDDRADVREVLYGPFDTTRDTHGMCNSFTRGLDGWLYACHGFNNQSTVSGQDGHAITMQSGNTFRMRVDGSRLEHVGHGQVNPFGLTFDRHGDLLTADCHTKPINLVLPGGYHQSFGKPHDGLGFVPNIMEHLHGSTGIAGIALGEAMHFPEDYQNSSFGGNVVTSRINRNRLVRRGGSLVAQEEADFLIPADPWFRPVDLQVGPDGALYVADFYNSIIGHYEVPLDHPARDRHRGRIWRITHEDSNERPPNLQQASTEQLVALLDTRNSTRTSLIIDELTRRDDAEAACRSVANASPESHIALLWTLFRLKKLEPKAVVDAAQSHQPTLVQVHALRLAGAMKSFAPRTQVIKTGLENDNGLIQRAAMMAATSHPDRSMIRELIKVRRTIPDHDVHTQQALKIALKAHLAESAWFDELSKTALSKQEITLLANVCLALSHQTAGEFLVDNLDTLRQADATTLTDYLRFAARSTGPSAVGTVVGLAREQFANDAKHQLELLQSIREGLAQRGVDVTQSLPEIEPLRAWAADLANDWLGSPDGGLGPFAWTASAPSGDSNAWTHSNRRHSADGQKNSLLWSSFPKGEPRIGTFRSAPFESGTSLQFYIAGHDGPPNKPPSGRNRIYLREAKTGFILHVAQPPRNDTAQAVRWKTTPGKQVYVELVDDDRRGAFAWLAVGRFSETRLNPTERAGQRSLGARLVEQFKLTSFQPLIGEILRNEHDFTESTPALAQAFVRLSGNSSSQLNVLAKALDQPTRDQSLRQRTIECILSLQNSDAFTLLAEWMDRLPRLGQLHLADSLASTPSGSTTLLALVQSGQASAELLHAPTVAQTFKTTLSQTQQSQVEELIQDLPDEDDALAELLAQRNQSYRDHGGSPAAGAEVFTEHCMVCHQIGGVGTVLGPNLDGIGNRGLERLTEDVLAPNRNVDIAFRLTAFVLESGEVKVGAIKRTEDARLIITDPSGQETAIPTRSITERTPLSLSLMPPTFSEALSKVKLRNLQAYLLTLRN